jgi:hypothetical protein
MALHFPGAWRFSIPAGSQPIPIKAVNDFSQLIVKVAAQAGGWEILELFKSNFAGTVGSTSGWSSSESWATTDLWEYMKSSAENPPLFLEALYDGFVTVHKSKGCDIPDVALINKICNDNNVGFEISPPNIIEVVSGTESITVLTPPTSFQERSIEILQESVERSEQLLNENRPREAVQEILWVLESVSTGFKGIALEDGEIKGKYFNQIASELKRNYSGTTFERVIDWSLQLHGYLSSPTGGGVRHGIDVGSGNTISKEEGRLFCNLIRSYINYFQAEHLKLNKSNNKGFSFLDDF